MGTSRKETLIGNLAKNWVNIRSDAILFWFNKVFFHFVKKLSNGSIRRFNEMSFPGFHEDSDSGCKAQVRTTRQSGLPSRPEWIFLRSGKPDFPPKMSELFRNHWFFRVVGSFSVFGGADVGRFGWRWTERLAKIIPLTQLSRHGLARAKATTLTLSP